MKIGDLVTLSSYGRKVVRTGWVCLDDVGIVTKIHKHFESVFYEVKWTKSRFAWKGLASAILYWGYEKRLYRRDLKRVRRESR